MIHRTHVRDASRDPAPPSLGGLRRCLALVVLVAGCATSSDSTSNQTTECTPDSTAPTYSELYTKYFAANTPGHCTTAGCHGDPGHNIWLCGPTKDTCYAGMLGQKLINVDDVLKSRLGDPKNSPLNWINPNGAMPADAAAPFPEGRDAILAWLDACAPSD